VKSVLNCFTAEEMLAHVCKDVPLYQFAEIFTTLMHGYKQLHCDTFVCFSSCNKESYRSLEKGHIFGPPACSTKRLTKIEFYDFQSASY